MASRLEHSAVRRICDDDNGGLTLPDGFCAVVVYDAKTATGAPARIRHIAVAPNGDVFVANQSSPGGVLALRDTDGDGKADQTAQFGTSPGNGIYFKNPYLYFAPDDRIERYQMSPASLTPVFGPEVIVSGLPADGSHRTKTIVVTDSGTLFVGVGSSTDSCQAVPGTVGGLGIDPCPDMPIRAGIWRYDGNLPQVHSATNRFATELRNLVAIALNPYDGELYGIQHGRGSLNRLFPSLFTPQDDAELPAEEFFHFREGGHYGWPYCYYDGRQQKKLLAPEYDGDGAHRQSLCGRGRSAPGVSRPLRAQRAALLRRYPVPAEGTGAQRSWRSMEEPIFRKATSWRSCVSPMVVPRTGRRSSRTASSVRVPSTCRRTPTIGRWD